MIYNKFHDNADGTFTVERTQQDLDKIISDNRDRYNSVSTKATPTMNENKRHVASIPLIIVEKLMADGIWGNQDRMKQWLNDPDNKYMRTHPGKV